MRACWLFRGIGPPLPRDVSPFSGGWEFLEFLFQGMGTFYRGMGPYFPVSVLPGAAVGFRAAARSERPTAQSGQPVFSTLFSFFVQFVSTFLLFSRFLKSGGRLCTGAHPQHQDGSPPRGKKNIRLPR